MTDTLTRQDIIWDDGKTQTTHLVTHAVLTNFDREVARYETRIEAAIEADRMDWEATCSPVIGKHFTPMDVTVCGVILPDLRAEYGTPEYPLCEDCTR